MTLRISGKSISIGEAIRDRVSARTDEVLRKYFDGNYSGHITLSKDGFGFRTDCALHLDSGITLEADAMAADAYASADQALLMIEKRLRRYKSRLKDRSARKTYAANAALVEGGGVLFRQGLEQQFVAHPPGRFAGAAFFRAEDGKVHLCGLQQADDAAGDFLDAAIVGGRTADPVENLEV